MLQHPPTVNDDVTQKPVGTKILTTTCEVFLDITHIFAPYPKEKKTILAAFFDKRRVCERLQ